MTSNFPIFIGLGSTSEEHNYEERIRLFYAHIPARFGVINPDAIDPPAVASDEWPESMP